MNGGHGESVRQTGATSTDHVCFTLLVPSLLLVATTEADDLDLHGAREWSRSRDLDALRCVPH